MIEEALFPELEAIRLPAPEKLSADRRRTLRQREAVANGIHPLTRTKFSADPEAKCGNCRFRELFEHHRKSYPKCTYDGNGVDRVTHSAASDVRAWWPGCTFHEWGDGRISPDAARWRPS